MATFSTRQAQRDSTTGSLSEQALKSVQLAQHQYIIQCRIGIDIREVEDNGAAIAIGSFAGKKLQKK
jgi:hypothetical protein